MGCYAVTWDILYICFFFCFQKLSFTFCKFLLSLLKNLNWHFIFRALTVVSVGMFQIGITDPLFLSPSFFRVKMAKVHCTWQLSMEGSHDHKPSFRMVREILLQCCCLDSVLTWVWLSVIWTRKMMLCFRWWSVLLRLDLHHPLMHFSKCSLSDISSPSSLGTRT